AGHRGAPAARSTPGAYRHPSPRSLGMLCGAFKFGPKPKRGAPAFSAARHGWIPRRILSYPPRIVLMVGLSDVTAEAVRDAIAECDDLGRVPFRLRYHFGPAREYELVYGGQRYDSKAIMGVAHRYATGRALAAGDVRG